MISRMERPTPHEARAALSAVEQMERVGLDRGLYSRSFAAAVSLWAGAIAVATAYDGPLATRGIAILLIAGFMGLVLRRRHILARVRSVHGAAGIVAVVAVPLAMLGSGLFAARAFEVYDESWIPIASGAAVSALLFIALEILRRATRGKLVRRSP